MLVFIVAVVSYLSLTPHNSSNNGGYPGTLDAGQGASETQHHHSEKPEETQGATDQHDQERPPEDFGRDIHPVPEFHGP